jgi:hypothetical protein
VALEQEPPVFHLLFVTSVLNTHVSSDAGSAGWSTKEGHLTHITRHSIDCKGIIYFEYLFTFIQYAAGVSAFLIDIKSF